MKRMSKKLIVIVALTWLVRIASAHATLMHVVDAYGNLATVDVLSGEVNVIGNTGAILTDIAFNPDGDLYGLSWTNFYEIDLDSGVATNLGAHGIWSANALVFSPDGIAYAAGQNNNLYTIDIATGAASIHHNTGTYAYGDLAFNEGNLYMTTIEGLQGYGLAKIDLAGRGPADLIGFLSQNDMWGIDTADDGVLYGVAGTSVYSIDTSNANTSLVSDYGGQGLWQAYGASYAVPEPSTIVLILLGAIGLRIKRTTHRSINKQN